MINLEEYHVEINQSFAISFAIDINTEKQAEDRATFNIRHKLAETLIGKHSTHQSSPGLMTAKISGFFFTEEQMRFFMEEMRLRYRRA